MGSCPPLQVMENGTHMADSSRNEDELAPLGLGLSLEDNLQKSPVKLTKTGIAILTVSGVVFAGVYAITAPFITPALRRICLPYVPATTTQVNNVLKALQDRSGSLIDIGSGDGRIVLETALHGFQSHGVELNVWLVLYSKIRAWRSELSQRARFFRKDLWKTDLSRYDNVVIFGVDKMMVPLEEKLRQELSVDGRVVACRFPLPNWTPIRTVGTGTDTVWLYKHSQGK